jgi:hypothetical protein
VAERERFELSMGQGPITVFETAAFNHSATSPGSRPGGPDRIRTGVLGLDRAACLARLHHGTDGG